MIRILSPFSFLAVPALWIAFQCGATFASTEFTGKVLGLDSVPIANAAVSLAQMTLPSGPVVKAESTVTDSAGKFSVIFDSVVAYDWAWYLSVAKTGYDPNVISISFAQSLGTPPQIDLGTRMLSKTRPSATSREMKFTILMPDGTTPAAGAIVTAVYLDDMSLIEAVAFLTDTADQQGQVDLNVQGSALSVGFIGMVADAPGSLGAQKILRKGNKWLGEFDGTAAGDTLRLQPQGIIEGTVRDAAGTPIPDYPVQLGRIVAYPGRGRTVAEYAESGTALTDSSGNFVLAARKTLYFNSLCRIQLSRPDSLDIGCPAFGTRVRKDMAVSAPSLQPKELDASYIAYGNMSAQGLKLAGNLVTETGAPVADATILLAYLNSDRAKVYDSTRSDKGGAFVLYTHSMEPGYVFTFLEYRKAGFVPYPVLGSWSSDASFLIRRGDYIAAVKLGTAAMLRDTEEIGPPQGLNRSSSLRMRRETGAGGSELWTFDVPYDQCLVRVVSPDGRLMFQGRLDTGIQAVRLSPMPAARILLVQWSSPQGRGAIKVPGF